MFPLRVNYETYALPLFSVRMWKACKLGAMLCKVCCPVFVFSLQFKFPPFPHLTIQTKGGHSRVKSTSSSAYKVLQPVKDSGLLNYFLPRFLFCTTFFQVHMYMLIISSKTSSLLGLPIDLLDMGFHFLIFSTLLPSAMRSTWPKKFDLCFLKNLIIFCPFNISLIS